MAIQRQFKKNFKNVKWRSGHIYEFKYQAWENDPKPLVIFMYAFRGRHPNTGREWRFMQCINFTYVSKTYRKAFANDWIKILERTNGNTRLTWELVKNKYSYLNLAVRRYFYSPGYYIQNPKEIPMDQIEAKITGSLAKDFSKKVQRQLAKKWRQVVKRRAGFKRTGRFPRRR